MASWFSRKAPATRQLTPDEKHQLDSLIALKNTLGNRSDSTLKKITEEAYARLEDKKPERSADFQKLNMNLGLNDLDAAVRLLYTMKGRTSRTLVGYPATGLPGSAAAPAPAAVVSPAAAVVSPAAAVVSPAAAVGSAPAPASTDPTPLQGTQRFLTKTFKGNSKTGAPGVLGHLIGTAGSAYESVYQSGIRRGGAQTRRNLRKRKSRASRANKATRRR